MSMADDEFERIIFEHPVISTLKVNAEVIEHLTNLEGYDELFPLMIDRIEAHSNLVLETSKKIVENTKLHLRRVK
jgi:hypothetical protein